MSFYPEKRIALKLKEKNIDVADEILNKYPNWDIHSMDFRVSKMRSDADFLEIAGPSSDDCVLEMGCGRGRISELIGRCGSKLVCLDISKEFLDVTKSRLKSQNIEAEYVCSSFYDVDKLKYEFDIVAFESSFHHCGDPVRLIKNLYNKLSTSGRIYFLNEAIYEWANRPWGTVDLNGQAAYVIRSAGWLEFGFHPDFFEQLLTRHGFCMTAHPISNGTILYEARKKC